MTIKPYIYLILSIMQRVLLCCDHRMDLMDSPPPYLPFAFSILPYIPFQVSNNSVHEMFILIISLAIRTLDWPTLSITCWRGTEEKVDSGISFYGFSIIYRRVLSMAVSSKAASVYKHHTMKMWMTCESKALHILALVGDEWLVSHSSYYVTQRKSFWH